MLATGPEDDRKIENAVNHMPHFMCDDFDLMRVSGWIIVFAIIVVIGVVIKHCKE